MLHPSMCPRATDSPPSPPQTHMISPLQYYDVPENDDNDEDDTDTAWFRMNPRDDRQPHGCDLNLLEASGVGEDDKQQQLLIPFEAAPVLPLALEEIEESSHHREYDNAYGPSLGFQLPVSRRPSSSSSTIPIPFAGMKRTLSEEQLCAEERMADVRDYVMFHRIVNGITKQQQGTIGYQSRRINDMCLASIIGARNLTEQELKSSTRGTPSSTTTTTTTLLPQAVPLAFLRERGTHIDHHHQKPLSVLDHRRPSLLSLLQVIHPSLLIPSSVDPVQSIRSFGDDNDEDNCVGGGFTSASPHTALAGGLDDEAIFDLEL